MNARSIGLGAARAAPGRLLPASRAPVPLRRGVIVAAKEGGNWWEKIGKDGFKNPFGGGDDKAGGGGFRGFGGGGKGGGRPEEPEPQDDGEERPELSMWEEFKQLMWGIWVVFWNTAMFLAFADILHRSLDWCCQIELLLLVGAPQQAFERAAAVFYSAIESFEKNVLGWDIPGDDDMIPMHENIALYYPEEHAYTFDAYRYNMTADEKKKLKHFHALRHYERDGAAPGEVDAADVQAISDKYEPMEADRRAYRAAVAQGTVKQYWDDKQATYKGMVRGPGGVPAAGASA